jgi:hypothetical protein
VIFFQGDQIHNWGDIFRKKYAQKEEISPNPFTLMVRMSKKSNCFIRPNFNKKLQEVTKKLPKSYKK